MNQFKFLILGLLIFNNATSQTYPTLNVNPSNLTPGTNTTVVFSGGPITFQNATCIEIYIQQGTNLIYQSASSVYYQGTNILVTSFYAASNSIIGAYNIIIFDFCKGSVLATYFNKMSVGISSIVDKLQDFFHFDIFPNPIEKGQDLNILNTTPLSRKNSIIVYDMMGKKVFEKFNLPKDYKLNTEILPTGQYYLQISNEEGSRFSQKIEIK